MHACRSTLEDPTHQVEEETGKVFVFEGSEGLPLEHFAVLLEGSRDEILQRAVPFAEGEEVHVDLVEPHMFTAGDAVAKIDGYIIQITGGERLVGEKHLVRIESAGRTSAVATLVDVSPEALAAAPAPAAPAPRARRSRSTTASGTKSTKSAAFSGTKSTKSAASSGTTGRSRRASKPATEEEAQAPAAPSDGADPEADVAPEAAPEVVAEPDENGDALDSKPRRRGRRGGRRRSGAKAESASTASSSE